MDRRKWGRPSPAIIVAVMALVAALAGTAIAGPTATTSLNKKKTKQIANQQAKKQIGNTLPIDAEDLGSIETTESSTTLNNNQNATVTASCEDGQKLLSGGYRWQDAPVNVNNLYVQASRKIDDSWQAIPVNRSGQNNRTFITYAYCLTNG